MALMEKNVKRATLTNQEREKNDLSQRVIPELLAPAGGWRQLKAAVQNGADAVYFGGPLFNARAKAENFTHEDIERAIAYAHDRDVKAYVAINTLIKDSELAKAFSYVNFLWGVGVDAVILQDLGLARLIAAYLPELQMHLSTQGTVYNKWAVDMVKEIGFQRVVPAREMTLSELRELAAVCHHGEPSCQVEVFVHGALCMCYSGQCQMSRLLGGVSGRSGNRGLCAQPCRLSYEDENGRKRFLLSPKDLCAIEEIPALCQAGIDSFKIEGRLKSPQYVAVATSIYRKYLDQYRDTGTVEVQMEDMQRLTQIFNRGGFCKGYLVGNPGVGLLSGKSPKNQGIYVGKVKAVKKGSSLVDVEASALSMGDGVEIRGSITTGNVISYLKPLSDGILRIGDIKEAVRPGDAVYKVTDKALILDAEKTYESDFKKKIPVHMCFSAKLGEVPELSIRQWGEASGEDVASEDGNLMAAKRGGRQSNVVKVTGTVPMEKAINRSLDEERVRTQLAKLGDTIFEARSIEIHMEEGLSLPISVLNTMRREAAAGLLQERRRHGRVPLAKKALEEIQEKEALGTELSKRGDGHSYIPLELFMEKRDPQNSDEAATSTVIPYILNVSKGCLDQYIEENFDAICARIRNTGILIGNLGWIKQFQAAGIKVYGDYGLNVYNRQCEKAFEEMGVAIKVCSHELEQEDTGKIPLMITEHPVTARRFKDRKGMSYTVVRNHFGDKYLIFANAPWEEKEHQLLIRK